MGTSHRHQQGDDMAHTEGRKDDRGHDREQEPGKDREKDCGRDDRSRDDRSKDTVPAQKRRGAGSRKHDPHAPRCTLRREAPSVVAVVAEQTHFAHMRAYSSFGFDDHALYLRQTEELLRTLAAQGVHTRVTLFHPGDYEHFCAAHRLEPDTPDNRARYAMQTAIAGTTLPYDGRPLAHLIPELRDAQTSRAAWSAAADVLARVGRCPDCGADVARLALERAAEALAVLLAAVGAGTHHLVCSVGVLGTPLVATLDTRHEPDDPGAASDGGLPPHRPPQAAAVALTTTLAVGLATHRPGGIVLRTEGAGEAGRDVVRGWGVDPESGWLRPLTTAEVFSAYCTDPASGDPVPPEHGVDYAPGHPLHRPGGRLHC